MMQIRTLALILIVTILLTGTVFATTSSSYAAKNKPMANSGVLDRGRTDTGGGSSGTGGGGVGGDGGGGSSHVHHHKGGNSFTSSSDTMTTATTTNGGGSNGANGGNGGRGSQGGAGGAGGSGDVVSSPSPTPTPTPTCDPGTHLKNGKCVSDTQSPTCDPGTHLKNGKCVSDTPVDCTKTPNDPSCLQKCPDGSKPDASGRCTPTPGTCPDGSTLKNGICQCPVNEHFNNNNKCMPDNINIIIRERPEIVRKTVIVKEHSNVIVHDFTEFTINPTHSKAVILLPTQNIQGPTGAMHILGNIFNSGSGTVRNVGQVSATLLDKNNDILAVLTAIPALNILKSHETTSFQIIIAPGTVKLTDIAFIKFELQPIVVSGSRTSASASIIP